MFPITSVWVIPSTQFHCQSCDIRTDVRRYISVKPSSVCIRDIVELQVSFIVVPLRDNKFKATMVLCSILVLDHTYTQVKRHALSIYLF